jgi:hypothetical protein
MIILTLLILTVTWILATLLTLKAESMLFQYKTDYDIHSFIFYTMFWWYVAIIILTSRHSTSNPEDYSKMEY